MAPPFNTLEHANDLIITTQRRCVAVQRIEAPQLILIAVSIPDVGSERLGLFAFEYLKNRIKSVG
jgi:hypothetical protein